MVKYSLTEVKTAKDIRRFLELPVEIYRGCDNWVRPIDEEVEQIFNPKANKLFNGGEATRWILSDESGKVVGRIAAFYNQGLSDVEKQPTGGCGFFECIDSQEAANILFDTARDYLKSKGMEAMDGPINFGTRESFWGLLVEGYTRPVWGMNYNHEYYKPLFENYGFKNYFNQHSYIKRFSEDDLSPQVAMRYERIMAQEGYEFRTMRKEDYEEMPRIFVDIYNKAWSNFVGVTPMTHEEGRELFKKLRPIMEDRLIMLSFYKGEAIGFYITIPDINGAIRHLDGKFGLWSKLKMLYHVKVRKSCDVILGLIFAVTPEFQGKGIESAMMETFRRLLVSQKHHYKYMELAWMGDFNPLMMRMVEKYVCATQCKMHTTYRYLFDRNAPFERAPRVSVSRKKEAELDAQQHN